MFHSKLFPSFGGKGDVKLRRELLYFLRVLDRELHVKVQKIDPNEQLDALKYLVISKLKEKYLDLEREFNDKKSHLKVGHSGIDYIGHLISTLPSKIQYFSADFESQEFKKISNLIKKIEKEVSHV